MSGRMTDEELQNPDNWDFEHAQVLPPVDRPGAVVKVRFSAEEFERVATCARRAGKPTAVFLRELALEKVASSSAA